MAANVTYIPPKAAKPEALRVAAYCRVSSDSSDQLHSYATQIKAYTEQIGAHADWELVDVYADEGLTGTRMDKREDFQRLLADCRKGKVDRVLCKSISRFARNTKDCLAALRELSALGVTVYFEKENIDTGTLTSELMVSVSGALAQQESISISQNQRMSYKRRMERGEFITCKAPFGYRLVEGKELEIIPEEAERVRWIFASYLSGKSLEWIAEQMEKAGIPTPDNAPYWQKTSILYILTNEKYIGDSLNQKYQKLADLLNQKNIPFSQEAPAWDKHKVKRLLENPRYTGQKGYPAILDGGTFHCVQSRIQEKTAKQTPKAERPALKLVSRLHCAACGAALHRMGGRNRQSDTLYLKCVQCGAVITMRDEVLLDEIARQTAEQERPERISYQPSGEVVRLTNAINRGLEHPDDPQEIVSLILQGAAARYACFPDITEQIDRPLDVCLDHIRLAVSHINLSEEGTVEAAFPSGHRERTEHGADCTAAGADHPRQEGY